MAYVSSLSGPFWDRWGFWGALSHFPLQTRAAVSLGVGQRHLRDWPVPLGAEFGLRSYVRYCKGVIRELHGLDSTHRASVPVKEVFQGNTVCEGIVEVFDLHGHDKANIAYAWSHATDNPAQPKRHVTVLHIPPAVSPETAVRVAIVQEFRNLAPAQG